MAPNHSEAIGYPFSDTNRYSPRIFNKNLLKFDVSTANDKIGFMRSLNLLCVNNSREFQSKVNWDVVTPGVQSSLPLKECSVVLNSVNWNTTGNLIDKQTNLTHRENLHCKSNMSERGSKNVSQGDQISTTSGALSVNTGIPESVDKTEVVKSNTSKRKSSNGSTMKLTFKIGDEVISKKYCKRKYFSKENYDEQMSSKVNQHDDCGKCDDVENSLCFSKVQSNITNCDEVCINEPSTETHVQTASKDKWHIAAILVQLELQRQRERSANAQDLKSKKQKNNNKITEKERVDDVVSEKNGVMPVISLVDDDVQEVLRITKNPKKLCNKSINTLRQDQVTTDKHCEIITIYDDDDDVCDDLTNDCVVTDERLSRYYLKDKENSYDFNLTVTHKSISKTYSIADRNQRNYCSDHGRPIKRQKLHNLDSKFLVTDRNTNPSLQLSLNKNFKKSRCSFNQLVRH